MSEPYPCTSCGDPRATDCPNCPKDTYLTQCRECHLEAAHGIIPRGTVHLTTGNAAGNPQRDREYHGGQHSRGEW